MNMLQQEQSEQFARIALGHVTRPFPNLPQLIMRGADDLGMPQSIHPIFYGSLDWHSCVHGYWLLARLTRLFPDFAARNDIESLFTRHVTIENSRIESAYFDPPIRRGFERPYGWAWLLKLSAELHDHPVLARFHEALAPLSQRILALFTDFLPLATYPVRVGTHLNSAFGMILALDYAALVPESGFEQALREKALAWYGRDRACQAWEPGGDEFLSSSLVEAAVMARVLKNDDFAGWFRTFLPDLATGQPETLFTPAIVSDRSDGKIAHLDGLNLSRVWSWKQILHALPADFAARERIEHAMLRHLDASLPHIAGDYMGEHWLATYAVMALQTGPNW